ncbi:MAG: hypothetical protein ACXVY8_08970 [Gaiellaceae bacterium]
MLRSALALALLALLAVIITIAASWYYALFAAQVWQPWIGG